MTRLAAFVVGFYMAMAHFGVDVHPGQFVMAGRIALHLHEPFYTQTSLTLCLTFTPREDLSRKPSKNVHHSQETLNVRSRLSILPTTPGLRSLRDKWPAS